MQSLTAPPREGLSAEAVRALLTADDLDLRAGLDLLSRSGEFVADISESLEAGEVGHDATATVHGWVNLTLTRRLAWGRDRVRPWIVLDDGTTSARFDLGVFVLTTPEEVRGTSPQTWEVEGYDLLHLLQDSPGDTYVVEAGTTYLQAVRNVVEASGVAAPLRIDGSLQDSALPEPMVWALTEEPTSWLRIANDLLTAINYRGLWADQDGTLRSEPFASARTRPVEWTFDTTDPKTDLLSEERRVTEDVWSAPNVWRFVRKDTAGQPVEGDGVYTVRNDESGPTSVASLGRERVKVSFLEVADQAALQAAGDRIVEEDQGAARRFEVSVDPLPIAGHGDVVRLKDAGQAEKCRVLSWVLSLTGERGEWSLEVVK